MIYRQNKVITVPNLLTTLRLLLVPVFVWAYFRRPGTLPIIILVFSGLTDILDGQIARRCNQISDVGKLLDPVADKLTQGAVLICLVMRFPAIWLPLGLMLVRESVVGITSVLAIKKSGRVEGAEMHGKVATVFLDALVLAHLLFGSSLSSTVSNTLIVATSVVMVISFVLYLKKNIRMIQGEGHG